MPNSAYQVVCTDIVETDRPLQVVQGRDAAIDLMIEKGKAGMSTMAFGVDDPPPRRRKRRGFTIPPAKGRAHRIVEPVAILIGGTIAAAVIAAGVLL